MLAERLNEISMFDVDMSRVQTNIVLAATRGPAVQVLDKMRQIGVLAVPFGPKLIRFVTHLDVPKQDCEEAAARLSQAFTK